MKRTMVRTSCHVRATREIKAIYDEGIYNIHGEGTRKRGRSIYISQLYKYYDSRSKLMVTHHIDSAVGVLLNYVRKLQEPITTDFKILSLPMQDKGMRLEGSTA